MELPKTEGGNRYVLVLQDFLSKWPLVYAMPDQKTSRIVKILVDEVVPVFGYLKLCCLTGVRIFSLIS